MQVFLKIRIFAVRLYLFQIMLNTMTIRLVVVFVMTAMFFCACSCGQRSAELLSQADSLVENYPDSALVLLGQIGRVDSLSDDERALYYLLLTQAQYKCYEPTTADSLMPFCVSHFVSCGDSYNHVRALYYNAVTGSRATIPMRPSACSRSVSAWLPAQAISFIRSKCIRLWAT